MDAILVVSGSRGITDQELVSKILDKALEEANLSQERVSRLVHGGSHGVDELASSWAQSKGISVQVIRPHWRVGAHAGLLRNTTLVQMATHVVAIWDTKSTGTLDTITKARKSSLEEGKWIRIYTVEKD